MRADTWEPLKQIDLTHLGPAERRQTPGAPSKDIPSTTIVVESCHYGHCWKLDRLSCYIYDSTNGMMQDKGCPIQQQYCQTSVSCVAVPIFMRVLTRMVFHAHCNIQGSMEIEGH